MGKNEILVKILIKHLAQCLASVNAQLKVTAGIIRGQ